MALPGIGKPVGTDIIPEGSGCLPFIVRNNFRDLLSEVVFLGNMVYSNCDAITRQSIELAAFASA
jgi:hypothetical protein